MKGILIILGIFIAIGFVLRLLRERYRWADFLTYAAMILLPLYAYLQNSDNGGVGAAIFFFFLCAVTIWPISGIARKTEVMGHKISCSHCHYGDLGEVSHSSNYIRMRCERCGAVVDWYFGNTKPSASASSRSPQNRDTSTADSRDDDSSNRGMYEYFKSKAEDSYREYEYYKDKASDAYRQAETEKGYAQYYENRAKESNDSMDMSDAQSYYEKAIKEYDQAREYESKASRCYDEYQDYKRSAERYL